MLDLRLIRENSEKVREGLRNRNDDPAMVDSVLELDERRRKLLQETEALKARRNTVSKQIGGAQADVAAQLKTEMRAVGERIKELDEAVRTCDSELAAVMLRIPNVPDDSVPVGKTSDDNPVVRVWGEPRKFDFEPKAHWDVGEQLGILDFARGAKLAEARFPLYKGLGVKLELALINFMLDLHTNEHKYTAILPPYMVNTRTMTASSNLPKFEDQLYKCRDDDLYLIPTAEVCLVNIHMDEILDGEQLPIYYTAYTPCFRREAGAAGRDVRGLIRVHQFNKVEMVKLTTPETSFQELEGMVANAQEVLQKLDLPHRVVLLCTGDMGFASAKTYDLEVWLPAQNTYREISSCSNCTDFQARRGNVRYRAKPGASPQFVHGLNGSGVAIGRTLVAILENYQQRDGSVVIPDALRPYMGGIDVIKR